MRIIHILIIICLTGISCKKDPLVKQTDKLSGHWTLTDYQEMQTDLEGTILNDISGPQTGAVDFIKATNVENDVFNEIRVEGFFAEAAFVKYFKKNGAGGSTPNGYAFYWDADPNQERIFFWAVAPGTSYHRIVNLEYPTKNSIKITFIEQDNAGQKRTFYSWLFKKQ